MPLSVATEALPPTLDLRKWTPTTSFVLPGRRHFHDGVRGFCLRTPEVKHLARKLLCQNVYNYVTELHWYPDSAAVILHSAMGISLALS